MCTTVPMPTGKVSLSLSPAPSLPARRNSSSGSDENIRRRRQRREQVGGESVAAETAGRQQAPSPLPAYAGALPESPAEAARLRKLYPPYSDAELDEAKKTQLIPGEVLYCEGAMKPSWRGVLHGWSLLLVPALAVVLLAKADTPTETLAASLFALCCLLLFLSSWSYHRVHWSPRWEVWMQKLDHCMIFIMVSGNVAPLSLLALNKTRLYVLTGSALVAAWGIIQIFRLQKNLVYFVLTASVMGLGLHELVAHMTSLELTLIIASWSQYFLGMLIYALGWPRLWPKHFSSHELMHTLIVTAAGTAAVVTYSLLARFDVSRCLWAR